MSGLPLRPILSMARLGNGAVAALGVLLGGQFASAPISAETFLGMGLFLLLVAAGNIHNDLLDLQTDQINRPERPLPSGLVSPKQTVAAISGVMVAIAIGALWATAHQRLLLAAIAFLLFFYNSFLKKRPWSGNQTVALLSATPFLWHGWPTPERSQWAAAAIAFCLNSTRELIKDLEDLPGDQIAKRQTLPVAKGVPKAVGALGRRYALVFGVAIILPYSAGWTLLQGVRYGTAAVLLVFPLLIHSLIQARRALLNRETAAPFWRVSQQSVKLAMVAGLIALFLGTL